MADCLTLDAVDRLIVQLEQIRALKSLFQQRRQIMIATDIGEIVGARVENLPLVTALLFSLVHGHVGVNDELLLGSAMEGDQGGAHADTVFDPAPLSA
nr:hypothetical protein [Marinobacter alexandrii]